MSRSIMQKKAKVELRKAEHGIPQPWHWVVIAPNGEVVLTSENYENKEDAEFQATQEAEARDFNYVDATSQGK